MEGTKRLYIKEADGFRFICVLGIIAYHIWQQSWLTPSFTLFGSRISLDGFIRSCYLFVDLLLTLSGFVLFLPYAQSALMDAPQPSLKTYYKSRIARIIPSYYLCIGIVFVYEAIAGSYSGISDMLKDLLPHISFTHVFWLRSYSATNLNTSLWTLAVEMQFYILFPVFAKAFKKQPLLTYAFMVIAAVCFRYLYAAKQQYTDMYINQLPAMLDAYANGMLAAYVCVYLHKNGTDKCVKAFSTVLVIVGIAAIYMLFISQTHEDGYENLRLGQLKRRYPLTLAGAMVLAFLSSGAKPLKLLFGNRVTKFLASISYQMYLWHAVIALKLKEWRIPDYASEANPQMNNEPDWQLKYTLLCYIATFVLSVLLTYLFEKKAYKHIMCKIDKQKAQSLK